MTVIHVDSSETQQHKTHRPNVVIDLNPIQKEIICDVIPLNKPEIPYFRKILSSVNIKMKISRNEMIWKNWRDFVLCVEWFPQLASHRFPILICTKWISHAGFAFRVRSVLFVFIERHDMETLIRWLYENFVFSFFRFNLSHFTKTCLLHVIVIKPKSLLSVAFPLGFVTSKSECRFANLKAERWKYQTKHQY